MPPRWTIQDRNANHIYLTEERWIHIIDDDNHSEMIDCDDLLIETMGSWIYHFDCKIVI